jgi:hypothetical protein
VILAATQHGELPARVGNFLSISLTRYVGFSFARTLLRRRNGPSAEVGTGGPVSFKLKRVRFQSNEAYLKLHSNRRSALGRAGGPHHAGKLAADIEGCTLTTSGNRTS